MKRDKAQLYSSFLAFDGWDWSILLREQPQLSNHCDWSKLNGSDWAGLLSEQPQFANHCDWSKFGGKDWYWLLRNQPQFANHCDWSKLDSWDWSTLLREQPSIIDDDSEEAQHLAVFVDVDLICKINKPCQTTIELATMLKL